MAESTVSSPVNIGHISRLLGDIAVTSSERNRQVTITAGVPQAALDTAISNHDPAWSDPDSTDVVMAAAKRRVADRTVAQVAVAADVIPRLQARLLDPLDLTRLTDRDQVKAALGNALSHLAREAVTNPDAAELYLRLTEEII